MRPFILTCTVGDAAEGIAYQKPSWQLSELQDETGENSPDKAVDGDLETASLAEHPDTPFWAVDLQAEYTVSYINYQPTEVKNGKYCGLFINLEKG